MTNSGTSGDKIILQIVPALVDKVLDNFEGETIMSWKNLCLKRLQGQDVAIWQMTDIVGRQREVDSSLFLPQVNAVIIFYEIKDHTVLVEWLRTVSEDIRLKNKVLFIVGCYQKGETTTKFEELFKNDENSRAFLWKIDDQEKIAEIYESIIGIIDGHDK